jgi:hypothetical protein
VACANSSCATADLGNKTIFPHYNYVFSFTLFLEAVYKKAKAVPLHAMKALGGEEV